MVLYHDMARDSSEKEASVPVHTTIWCVKAVSYGQVKSWNYRVNVKSIWCVKHMWAVSHSPGDGSAFSPRKNAGARVSTICFDPDSAVCVIVSMKSKRGDDVTAIFPGCMKKAPHDNAVKVAFVWRHVYNWMKKYIEKLRKIWQLHCNFTADSEADVKFNLNITFFFWQTTMNIKTLGKIR